MGKSGRHKKLNRQEKAKTNLKGVKKLGKAQNVVEPTLKVKRIVIREQLASASGDLSSTAEVTTHRKQTLGDILSSLRHHNTSIRREALGGLTELVTSSPGILKNSLDKVLERLLFLLQDLESSVRVENLKCAQALFERLSEHHLSAYWSLVLSHVKAAITHLNAKVRTHTLSFLRLLTTHFPGQMKASANSVLAPVLALLGGGAGAGGPEVLKATGVKERLAVFSLVGSILSLEDQTQEEDEEDGNPKKISVFSGQERRKCPGGLVYSTGYFGGGVKSVWEEGGKEDETWWGAFVSQAVKLVTATWVEVKEGGGGRKRRVEREDPDCEMIDLEEGKGKKARSSRVKTTPLNAAEVEVLDSLVGVLYSVIQRLSAAATTGKGGFANSTIESLRKNEGPDLKKYFINLLPFEASNAQISSKLVMTLNLRLFFVASQLRLIDSKIGGTLGSYLVNIADAGLDAEHINLSLRILQDFKLGSVDRRELCTSFLCSVLDGEVEEQWREVCLRIEDFLRLNRRSSEDEQEKKDSFIHSVDWNEVVVVLGRKEKVTKEMLGTFTNLQLRNLGINNLSGVVESLMEKGCFKPFMERNKMSKEDYKAMQRFVWYMDMKHKLDEHELASVMSEVGV